MLNVDGMTFGRLTVVKRVRRYEPGIKWVLVKCSCGAQKEVRLGDLRDGKILSCGCYRKDRRRI